MDAPRAIDAKSIDAATRDARVIDATPPDAEAAPQWTQLTPSTTPPVAQWAGFAYDNTRHQVIRYGGSGSDPNSGDETWAWDGSDWSELSPVHSPDTVGDELEPTMAFDSDHDNIVLFHTNEQNNASDTWLWDGEDWTMTSPAHAPSERSNVALAYDSVRHQMIMFGGYSGGYLNETWAWDGSDWTQLNPSAAPSARWDANMVFDEARQQIVLFGGYGMVGNNYVESNETWIWNGTTWAQLTPTNTPPGRDSAAFAYDSIRGEALLFGGSGSNGGLNDTWAWDGSDWTQLTTTTAPSTRQGVRMAFDIMHNNMVLFGGYADVEGYENDTWTLASPTSS